MAGQHTPGGVELGADRLGDAQDDPADEGAPQRAEPADDDGLEREDQHDRTEGRRELGTHAQEHAGQADRAQGERGGQGVDLLVGDAHHLHRGRVIRRCAHRPTQRRVGQEQLDRHDREHADHEGEQRERADRQATTELHAGGAEVADGQRARVGREHLLQHLGQDHRQAERDQQRRHLTHRRCLLPHRDRPVEQQPLQQVAQAGHQHDHDRDRDPHVHPGLHQHHAQVGSRDRQHTVGEVHDPHHTEHERQACGEQGVQAAQQNALDEGVDPHHQEASLIPKYADVISSRDRDAGVPSSTTRPSNRHSSRSATRSAWFTSCSTNSTLVPSATIAGTAA